MEVRFISIWVKELFFEIVITLVIKYTHSEGAWSWLCLMEIYLDFLNGWLNVYSTTYGSYH